MDEKFATAGGLVWFLARDAGGDVWRTAQSGH